MGGACTLGGGVKSKLGLCEVCDGGLDSSNDEDDALPLGGKRNDVGICFDEDFSVWSWL